MCLSWIKHLILHVQCQLKGKVPPSTQHAFSYLPPVLSSHCFFIWPGFFIPISMSETSACHHNTMKSEWSFVCGADRVSSRNNVLAPRDNQRTSSSTVCGGFLVKTVAYNSCYTKTTLMVIEAAGITGNVYFSYRWCNPAIIIGNKCIVVKPCLK